MNELEIQNAKITDVYLGHGDRTHGFFTVLLEFDYGDNGAQGCFLHPSKIPSLLTALNLDNFMDLKGRMVRVEHNWNHVEAIGDILKNYWVQVAGREEEKNG